jgi:hypothetical protein
MLEQAMEALTFEIRKLREAVERQTELLRVQRAEPGQQKTTQTAQPEWMNERAAARLIGVSVNCLRKWRLFNQGPPFRKLGRMVRYGRDDLAKWLDSRPGGGGRDPAQPPW